jgi:hypothetical protein
MDVAWNNPPKIPIPLFKNKKLRLSYEIKAAITKIVIDALEYRMDLSRLDVIEFDNINIISDRINIVYLIFLVCFFFLFFFTTEYRVKYAYFFFLYITLL